MKSRKENNAFGFYRFSFACVIFLLHIRTYAGFESRNWAFYGGYLGVEFFFILSGFLMMDKVEEGQKSIVKGASPELLAVTYFVSRYKRLIPPYWFSLIVLFGVDMVVLHDFSLWANLWRGIPEFLGIQVFFRPTEINDQLWFVSALLWAGLLVYYLLLKYRNQMLYIVFPLGLLTFIGYIYQNVGYIDLTQNTPVFLAPFFRAFFEIGFGCILCDVYNAYRRRAQELVRCKGLWSLAEILLFALAVVIMWRTWRDYKDFLMVFLLGGLILVTAFEEGGFSKLLDNKLSAALGGISYDVYINQLIFQRIVLSKFRGYPYWPVAFILLAITIGYSFLTKTIRKNIEAKIKMKYFKDAS